MPQALAPFLINLGTGLAGSFGITVGATAGLAIGITTVVAGAVSFRRIRSLKTPETVSGPSLLRVAGPSTTAPRNIVYGESLVGGPLTFANVNGQMDDRQLFFEVVHTTHPIDSFVGWKFRDRIIYLADVDDINASPAGNGSVDSDTNSHGLGPVQSGVVCYLRGHLGATDQLVDSMLESYFPEIAGSPSTHRHRGCARTIARFAYIYGAEDRFDDVPPEPPLAIIKGKKVYDPRQDGTQGYSPDGGQRLATPSTWTYSNNPALCLADYLIDSDWGPGFASSRIDYGAVATAADICDALVEIPPAVSPAVTEKRFSCNLTVHTGMEHIDIIDRILETMNGRLQYVNGQFRIYASAWETTSFSLSDSDLVGDYVWQKQPSTQRGDRYNQVKGTFLDPDRNWQMSSFVQVDDTTLRTNRDNSRVLPLELELPGVTSPYQAQRLAILALEQADATGVLQFPAGYQAADIRVGDTGTVTLSEMGFNSKTFRCVGVNYVDFEGVLLTLKEDGSGNYDDPTVGEYGTTGTPGVISFSRIRKSSPLDGISLIADPFFSRIVEFWDESGYSNGDNLKYFWKDSIFDSGSPLNSSVSIRRTGGVTGGLVRFIYDGSDNDILSIYSLPREFSRFITGEVIRISFRVRKTTDPSPAPSSGLVRVFAGGGSRFGDIDQAATGSPFDLDQTDVNAWTVNEWQEYSFEVTMANATKSLPQLGYLIVGATVANLDADMTIEFDGILPTRVGL